MRAPRNTLRHLALVAALLAATTATRAVERWSGLADSVFQQLARDNEMPSSALPTAVAQDGEGFLWIGSQNGLARWDGYHFRIFRADPGKAGALPDNIIQTLHTDAQGVLWIGMISGGLARYDREHDRFIVYPTGPHGISNVSVRAIADDGSGGVWVGTEGGGLDHVRPNSTAIEYLQHNDSDPHSLPDDRVRGLLRDRHGALWVGMASGLARMDNSTDGFVTVSLPAPEGKLPTVSNFLEDSGGRIWIGTVRQGAYVIDSRGAVAHAVQESDVAHSTLQDEGVGAIIEPLAGQIWLGTVGQGIVTLDVATGRTRRIRHDPAVPSSLADDTIQALYRDRSGLVWICTNRSISRYDAAQTAVLTVFGGSSRTESISDTNIDSVLPMPDGHVWLGLDSNGIDILDPAGVRVAGLRPDPAHPEIGLPRDYINAFAPTANGDIYIGTEQGLYRADPEGRRALRISVPKRDPAAAVWALLLDGSVLWLGGSDGLWVVDLANGKPVSSTHIDATDGLTDQRITSIERDDANHLWVGTKNGLNHLNVVSHAIERIVPESTNASSLSASYVTSLLTDSRGRLWVATFGGGVDVLESRDPSNHLRFHHIGIAQGFVNENTNKLLEDLQHQIWVSTDEGLAVVDEHTFAVRTLRVAEGLPISSYWVGSGAVTQQGELLFGGVGGLTIVRPARLAPWNYHPPIVVTDVRVGGKPVAPGRLGLDDVTDLTVSPTANSLTVEFSSLDYSAPERNRYAYRLEGFDTGWVDTEAARRLAAYTNLPPGEYRLHLRGSNRDGVWSERAVSIPIRVLPAWYQTLAFRIVVLLFGLGVIAALIQVRTVYLRRHQRDLERQVVERTAELRESQRQLEQIAYYDTLTALPNRRMFTEEFRELIVLARLQNERFALLLIDLDRFKQINDSRGHDAGDALLIEAAIRLQAAVRKSDCVARLGGDEFAVLVAHNPAASDIENICHRIIEGFVMPVAFKGLSVKSSASIGVAVFPDHGATLDSLYKSADLALYEAKRAGGNLWRWYHTQIPSATIHHAVRVP